MSIYILVRILEKFEDANRVIRNRNLKDIVFMWKS